MDDRAQKLIDCIYEAAVQPDAWRDVIAGISEIFDRSPTTLGFFVQGNGPLVPSVSTGLRESCSARFGEYLQKDLGWSVRHTLRSRDRFRDLSEIFDDVTLEQTDFYREWMKPQGLAPLWPLTHALAAEAGDPVGLITIFRAEGQDPFTEEECREAEQYMPHLRRAVAIREEFQGAQRTRLALAEVMDRLPMGMLLLDDTRQVVTQNQAAERIVEREDGLCVDRGGPSVANARENAALQTLIADAIEGKIGRAFGSRGFLSVTRQSGKRPLSVMVASLTGLERGSPAGDAVVAVFVSDPELQRISGPKALAKLYGLTQSEAEILQLLSMGMSLEAAAASRGVSMNTARSHIKHVFAKTGVSRQGELVRLICSGVGSVRQK